MKLMWLGQNGFLFDFDGIKIMIDPYLTDSLSKQDKIFSRRIKVNKKLFKARPDVIILTNGHLDHADNDSLIRLMKYVSKKRVLMLSCESVYNDITTIPALSSANHIMFEKNSEWTVGNINIRAVTAKTDDKSAFGVIITNFADNKKYYIAGDTLYNKLVLDSLDEDIYASFIPINGEYGSMNVTDAKRFALKMKSRFFVPIHFGMFDKIDPKLFDLTNAIIPKPYKIINFDDYESTVINPYKEEKEVHIDNEETSQIASDNNDATVIVSNYEKQLSENNEAVKDDLVEKVIEDSVIEDNVVEEIVENDVVKNDVVEDNVVEEIIEDVVEDNVDEEIVEDVVEDDVVEEIVENDVVKNDVVENNVDEEIVEDVVEDDIDEVIIEDGANEDNIVDEAFIENYETTNVNEATEEIPEYDVVITEEIVEESDNLEDFVDNDEENEDDNKDDESDDSEVDNNEDGEVIAYKEMSDSEKIDAIIREIEKHERGETADFSKIK